MKNEPAFPVSERRAAFEGLSKRELFAAMAMQGILSEAWNYEELNLGEGEKAGLDMPSAVAEASTAFADALLAELEKTK